MASDPTPPRFSRRALLAASAGGAVLLDLAAEMAVHFIGRTEPPRPRER
jgi:carbamoylphosphate synthase large subunit